MLRITLRSFWEHKRRLISTIVAIVLGVAFMAGTFVLADTLDQVFDDLFAEGTGRELCERIREFDRETPVLFF